MRMACPPVLGGEPQSNTVRKTMDAVRTKAAPSTRTTRPKLGFMPVRIAEFASGRGRASYLSE